MLHILTNYCNRKVKILLIPKYFKFIEQLFDNIFLDTIVGLEGEIERTF